MRFLGIDIGTSAAKGVVIDGAGAILGAASAEYPLSSPREGWSEQDPEHWWDATCAICRELTRKGLVPDALGFSGQMHGSVFLDASAPSSGGTSRALRPALLWNDQRTAAQCREIEAAVGGRRALVDMVGNAALTGFTLPKVLWLREHEPAVFARLATLLLPKDFVRFRLTGELATDVGDASGTLLFDVERRAANAAAFKAVGLPESLLPRTLESAARAGAITEWGAAQTGLRVGTPVAAGSGDNMAGAVGAGVVEPGMILATLGTSGVIYAHSERPRKDIHDAHASGRLHTMCAGTGDDRAGGRAWCITGCMLSAGGSLRWARDTIAPGASYDALMAEASQAPPGCDGLVFLPHLTGERCPYPDPAARAGWIGLTSRHTRAHLLRAVIEGVSFSMAQILDLARGIDIPVTSIRIGGGGARSPLWRQIQADLYGLPVDTTNTEDGPAYGAALMAGVAAAHWPSIAAACRETIRVTSTTAPGSRGREPYGASRAFFDHLYPILAPEFSRLSGITT